MASKKSFKNNPALAYISATEEEPSEDIQQEDKIEEQAKKEALKKEIERQRAKEKEKEAENKGEKTKGISFRCTEETFNLFKKINKKEGMSGGSVLNMLVNQYIRQKRHILDD